MALRNLAPLSTAATCEEVRAALGAADADGAFAR